MSAPGRPRGQPPIAQREGRPASAGPTGLDADRRALLRAGLLGASGLGWGLVWLVAALAALNAFGGFCVGCAVYYWLNRLQIPGFRKAPPAGTFPGMRPQQGGE